MTFFQRDEYVTEFTQAYNILQLIIDKSILFYLKKLINLITNLSDLNT